MSPALRYWLVMPAAGVGRRFGSALPKQYATLGGRTVIEWALAPFLSDPRCSGAVVVIAEEDRHWPELATRFPGLLRAPGGHERSSSVASGLATLSAHARAEEWVLVHDAARPCISPAEIDALLYAAQDHPVGAILGLPAADTLKRAGEHGAILNTVARDGLWRALTPQMFRLAMLREALEQAARAGRTPTDESQALEWTGRQPLLVQGSAANIKITTGDDLRVAGALLRARADSHTEATAP